MDRLLAHICITLLVFVLNKCYSAFPESTLDVCEDESFSARCPYSQRIMVTWARYGHLQIGRCIEMDFGYFGCQADVTDILHNRCSGQQRCEVPLDDDQIKATAPCPKGLETYLKASYVCIPETVNIQDCSLDALTRRQYLTSRQVNTHSCPQGLTIHAQANMKVKFTFTSLQHGASNVSQVVGHIVDGLYDNGTIPITRNPSNRDLTSISDCPKVIIEDNTAMLLVGFQAVGCVDLDPPAYSWVKRKGDEIILGCDYTQHFWKLQCIGSKWIGSLGNCTNKPAIVVEETVRGDTARIEPKAKPSEKLSKEILYALIIGFTLFLCVTVITVGYVCLKKAHYATKSPECVQMSNVVYDGYNSTSWTRDTNTKKKPVMNNLTNTWQSAATQPLVSDTTGTVQGRPQQYIVLDQDYVNATETT